MRSLLAVVLGALLAGCTQLDDRVEDAVGPSGSAIDCGGHRHATFAVFLPEGDGFQQVDLAAPKDAAGRPYYQLGIAPRMDLAAHMHQTGAEVGSADLGPTQMHYEDDEACITLAHTLHVVDVEATTLSLQVAGRHPPASFGAQDGGSLHTYVQEVPADGPCAWVWAEQPPAEALARDVGDGMSLLVLWGDPTAQQVAALQQSVPVPMERPEPACDDEASAQALAA